MIVAFALAMWLLTSALTGYEKNKLRGIERILRVAAGLGILLPNVFFALPAVCGGVALIVIHRFLGGEPSSVETTISNKANT